MRFTRDGVSKPLLSATFASILVLLSVLQVVAYIEGRDSQRRVGEIVTNALHSVELVAQLGMDIERERLLTERHIFESSQTEMAHLERDLAARRADFAEAAAAFAPLIAFPGEASAWYQLARDNALKDGLVPAVLELSRADRDVEARARLAGMQTLFDSIQADIARLIAINNAGAETAREQLREIESSARDFRAALGISAALVLAAIGVMLTRVLARNERELRRNAVDLQRKNHELDAFAGRVAHDLRGPLSTVGIAASLIADQRPAGTRSVEILQRGITQMTHIVDELLELSRIGVTAGSAARIEPVARLLAEDLAPKVRDAGGTLRVDLEPANVRCSEGLLRQLLWNLGENALKYRRPDAAPAIAITGKAGRDGYEVAITDNGIGMTPEDAAHVFEPFFRAQRTSSLPGTGLGLAIVRRVVDACGGTVAVSSELGRGTRVDLRLPLAES